MKDSLWVFVLESALEDRQDFLRRLKARPTEHASEQERLSLEFRILTAEAEINEICADLEKARGQ